jgi:hypothetical protein
VVLLKVQFWALPWFPSIHAHQWMTGCLALSHLDDNSAENYWVLIICRPTFEDFTAILLYIYHIPKGRVRLFSLHRWGKQKHRELKSLAGGYTAGKWAGIQSHALYHYSSLYGKPWSNQHAQAIPKYNHLMPYPKTNTIRQPHSWICHMRFWSSSQNNKKSVRHSGSHLKSLILGGGHRKDCGLILTRTKI